MLEHSRIAQWDILDYIRSRAYLAPTWPGEYWPARDTTATPAQFARTVEGFRSDRTALHGLVADPATDLLTTIPNTRGHTILREVRLVGDHNAYHVGEFTILRQVMGTWRHGREELHSSYGAPSRRTRAATGHGLDQPVARRLQTIRGS